MSITGWSCVDQQCRPVRCDAQGTDAAVACDCAGGGFFNANLRDGNQRGAKATNPSTCVVCGRKYWVEKDTPNKRLIRHPVP